MQGRLASKQNATSATEVGSKSRVVKEHIKYGDRAMIRCKLQHSRSKFSRWTRCRLQCQAVRLKLVCKHHDVI